MKTVIQRVKSARVDVDGNTVGEIGRGLLVLVGVERGDAHSNADKLLKKLLQMRLFSDADGKMNLNVADIGGGVLLVSQFTLAADTAKGNRPGFSSAAAPSEAKAIYQYLVDQCQKAHQPVATGVFAADMQVSLCNDGPVTFILTT